MIEAVPLEQYQREKDLQSSRLRTVCAARFDGKPVPPRGWHVEELIPSGTVTLLNGDGGTGKSLLALQLAVATVAGGYWAGRPVSSGPCLYLSAEDDTDELHRRLVDIAASASISLADLDRLTIAPLAGENAMLAAPEGKGNVLKETPLYKALDAYIRDEQPILLILDTLADMFGGEENQRAQARQFIGLLRRLCVQHGVTVLTLAHPSLAGMASGTGSSGSTAWNNSVRSRLYLDRVKSSDGIEDDPDVRVLKTVKANYGRTGQEIRLRWQAGAFSANAATTDSFTVLAVQSKADRVFLSLLAAYTEEGRPVSAATGHGYAPALFARDNRAEGVGKSGFIAAMNRLFAAGKIENVETGPPSRRVRRIVISGEGQ